MSNPLDSLFGGNGGGGNGLIGKLLSIAGAADKVKSTVSDINKRGARAVALDMAKENKDFKEFWDKYAELPLEQAVEGISRDYGYDPGQVRGLLRMFGIRL